MRHLDFHAIALDGCDHLVGVDEIFGEGLLGKDVATGISRGGDHLDALVEPTRSNGDDVELLFLDHLVVVGVGFGSAGTIDGLGSACFVSVSDGGYFHEVKRAPDGIESMTVVAVTGVSDDADAILLRFRGSCGGESGEAALKERTSIHGATPEAAQVRGLTTTASGF